MDATNAPGVQALLEEWCVAPLADGGTRVRWTVAADGPPAVRAVLHAARPALGYAFRDALRSLDRHLAAAAAA